MGFRGWPVEAVEFFEGLEADNTKTYWQSSKATYERAVRAPMEALLAELAPLFGQGKIFRPYRDVRFSADKSPYKTNIGATIGDAVYVELSAHGLAAGSGYWHMAPDQLARYRAAVADDARGKELADVLDGLAARGIGTVAHSRLKTAPKGYPRDHPRVELLQLKGLATWRAWPVAAWLGTARAKERIVEFAKASEPVRHWLEAHVGPSLEPPADRR